MFGAPAHVGCNENTSQRSRWKFVQRNLRTIRESVCSHYWWMWTFVGLVSLYDAWLVVVFREIIHEVEENPVGRMLIALDSNGISYFLAAKAVGTIVVLLSLIAVHRVTQRYRDWIMGAVAAFQAWLLFYLSFAGAG